MLTGNPVPAASRRGGRVTIAMVAEALGVTKGTVSRALNDYPDISAATRARVRRVAERMGYRPLAQAQAIRTGRTRTLGLVLQTDIPGAQRPFLSDFLAGLTGAASAEHWTLTVATSAGGRRMLETLERLVDERKADGFILPARSRTIQGSGCCDASACPSCCSGASPIPRAAPGSTCWARTRCGTRCCGWPDRGTGGSAS